MTMSTAYELTGRTRQKARTRAALIGAARELLAEGTTPTVEQAADRAGISRTTAYRYFRNQRALLVGTYPEIETSSLLGDAPPDDPRERLEIVTKRIGDQLLEHEPELRAQLRIALDSRSDKTVLPLRRGRAITWLEDALAPLRETMPEHQVRRLVLAIRATLGIEPLVWLTDVAGLSREEAVELMRSSARTLAEVAIAHGRTEGAPRG